ncbi:DNA-binding protein [Nitratireductor aestuarii]|uniref:DNA-binding protein n=1 Tax=Nitratireductor aestuarii TaxID=1735103 RepID=A0A916RJJ0_9HYPH|nr:hemolysin III family protein [Nitratireductor aestuarii]GGA59687.1 DNA-binding protein [Nitratireductor aestuarii]
MNEMSWRYDRSESIADGAIHVAGVLFALMGAGALIIGNLWHPEPGVALAASVYAVTLVATLTMSAVYNMWPVSPVKWKLRKYDHAAIFLLIAGTYTPFALQMEATGLLVWMWSVAATGVFLKIVFPGRFDRLAILLYLGLGWSGAALFDTMLTSLSPTVLWLILAGGVVYSVGVVFHVWHSLRFQNAIWHGFVLAGAIIHYSAVFVSLTGSPAA